ncbi:DUF5709 domain-containing protein [Streptomyces sp. H27-G5]|uniref:DUF5709 domain-containing protein n=1 Tax=Streptomyces sp. H27-G5 TaxID=2996698 RepID=UPI002271A501|nr:DUF5709 domain-containing protein [Streptomyces sp. H27-G5]MCY0920033.1 DUF5709 domain-containing protein [Streptomyces sp. H27-G5]
MVDETNGQGDDVYQPQDTDQTSEGQPDMENALDEPNADLGLDEGYRTAADRPSVVTRHGTTGREQSEGQSLEERLAEEVPEIGDAPRAPFLLDEDGVGRLVSVTEAGSRRNTDVMGFDAGDDAGEESAEEAAMHVVGRNVAAGTSESRHHILSWEDPPETEEETETATATEAEPTG